MAMVEKRDFQRMNQSILSYLETGEYDVCLSLLRVMKVTLERYTEVMSEITDALHPITQKIKNILIDKRFELEEESYRKILTLYEESIATLTLEGQQSIATGKEEVYLSTGEVAQKLGVSSQTILNMINDGRIDATRPTGTHYKIPASQFEEKDRQIEQFRKVTAKLHAKIGQEITEEDLLDL